MYLRQSNKWKEFLLAEAIENVGLPPRVVTWIRRRAKYTADGDANAATLANQQGVELQEIDEKHLTWQLSTRILWKLIELEAAANTCYIITT